MVSNKDFFRAPEKHSEIKTRIVVDYFLAWLSIMAQKSVSLTYLDLFSGRGRYENGDSATPLRILDAIERFDNQEVYRKLRMHFYEGKKSYFDYLEGFVNSHSTFEKFSSKPQLYHETISQEIIPKLPTNDSTFTFVDPYGNKGNSLNLLLSVVRNWGCDCIFYLSISGIDRNIDGTVRGAHLRELFGDERLKKLRAARDDGTRAKKFHRLVLQELKEALNDKQQIYFLPFAVDFENRKRTSHFIIFLSKHHLGFSLMKDIMGRHRMSDADGIPLYLLPGDRSELVQGQLDLHDGMDQLEKGLLENFRGRTIQVGILTDELHRNKTLYRTKNIKDALARLADAKKLEVDTATGRPRRAGTMGDRNTVRFTN